MEYSNKSKFKEILKGIILIVFLFSMASLSPEEPIDPWGILKLQKIIFLIALIASIQLMGFVSNLILGHKVGLIVTGFLGGVISSTAVYTSLPRNVQHNPQTYQQAVAAGLSALVAMKLQMLVIMFSISRELFISFLFPISMMVLASFLLIFILTKQLAGKSMDFLKHTKSVDIVSVLKLSFLIAAMLAGVAWTKKFLGEEAILLASFLSGLFELHGITLANSMLASEKEIPFEIARNSIGIALIASYLSKLGITWSLDRTAYARSTTWSLFIVMIVGALSFLMS